MKIGIIGATGKAGSFILKEALERGHEVTAIVRDASKLENKDVAVIESDIFDLGSYDFEDLDVVVNAFGAPAGDEHLHVEAGRILINALEQVPHVRLIVVGGAGSLYVDEEKKTRLLDTPEFPKEYYPTAANQAKNLEDLQKTTGIKWTFVSPAIFFDPNGARTGSYVVGKDHPAVNSQGESYISYADYAIAILDEIENPKHINERFTVAGEKA